MHRNGSEQAPTKILATRTDILWPRTSQRNVRPIQARRVSQRDGLSAVKLLCQTGSNWAFALDPLPSAGMFCRSRRGWIPPSGPTEQRYEATISAIENPPQAAARLPQPQLHQERAGHSAQSAPRRAQTPYARLTRGGLSA